MKVLFWFVYFGVFDSILVDVYLYIGINKFLQLIVVMWEEIIVKGGEVCFGMKLIDLIVNDGWIIVVCVNDGEEILVDDLVLVIGYSV